MIGLGQGLSVGLPSGKTGGGFAGALDGLSSGLRDAWSVVRRPLASYTGPLVQVRRESDNDETLIYSRADGRLDVAAAADFKGASLLRVVKVFGAMGWRDLYQNNVADQPQLVLTGGINGGPSVLKDQESYSSQMLLLDYSIQPGDTCYLIEQSLQPAMWQRGFTIVGWAGREFHLSSGATNLAQFTMESDLSPPLGTTDAVCEIFANTSGGPVRCWSNGVDAAPGTPQQGLPTYLTQNSIFCGSAGKQLFAELGIWNYGFGDAEAALLWARTNPAHL